MPPEHLLKASLLIALYSVRSERQFCERLTYDMLFRWFLDMNIRGGSFDQSTFAKNRTRLLAHEVTPACRPLPRDWTLPRPQGPHANESASPAVLPRVYRLPRQCR